MKTMWKITFVMWAIIIACATAQAQTYTIYNPDGSITTVTPNGNGGYTIWAGNGGIGWIQPNPPRHDSGYDYNRYPTWGNRWSPLDNPYDNGF